VNITLLSFDDPIYVRRLAAEIRARCGVDGFYSGFGVETGQRKFSHAKVRKGRLIAHEVGGRDVDLTGAAFVQSPRAGDVAASRTMTARQARERKAAADAAEEKLRADAALREDFRRDGW